MRAGSLREFLVLVNRARYWNTPDMAYFVKPDDRAPAVTAPIHPDESLPRVCVIGAGSSGIAAAKTLYMARVPFDCFEKGSDIGGNWVFQNTNGQSACYETLEINTSCPRMAYSDFPMPEDYPDYASHEQVHAYFEDYVQHFGFRHTIQFNSEVTRVSPLSDGRWEVRVQGPNGETTHIYDAVMVANGHHWDPKWPEPGYPGEFAGTQMHAHDFLSGDQLEGHDVLVVGGGNSAMDISVEAARRAKSAHISLRRGQWILPKFAFGRPADQVTLPAWMPWWVTGLRMRLGALVSGGWKKYGLPKPPHSPGQSHPVLSDKIKVELLSGALKVKPAIDRFDGDKVWFVDGTHITADLIVWCTGYRVSFPFLDSSLVNPQENDLPLWKRTVHPDLPGLYFIGLLQPFGAVMPLAEAQSIWVRDTLIGAYVPPSENEIREQMVRNHEKNKKHFYESPRHTMEVDFDYFIWDLNRERKAGAKRAAHLQHRQAS